jgi:hypothetical protein
MSRHAVSDRVRLSYTENDCPALLSQSDLGSGDGWRLAIVAVPVCACGWKWGLPGIILCVVPILALIVLYNYRVPYKVGNQDAERLYADEDGYKLLERADVLMKERRRLLMRRPLRDNARNQLAYDLLMNSWRKKWRAHLELETALARQQQTRLMVLVNMLTHAS